MTRQLFAAQLRKGKKVTVFLFFRRSLLIKTGIFSRPVGLVGTYGYGELMI